MARAITPRRASRGAAAAPARRTWAAPPAAAPLAGRWARIPSRRRRPVTDEPARVSRGGAQSRHLAPAIFFVAPVSEMTFGGRSRSGPLAPNRHWSRMGAMRGRARSAAAERRRGAAPTATRALGGRGAAVCVPLNSIHTDWQADWPGSLTLTIAPIDLVLANTGHLRKNESAFFEYSMTSCRRQSEDSRLEMSFLAMWLPMASGRGCQERCGASSSLLLSSRNSPVASRIREFAIQKG